MSEQTKSQQTLSIHGKEVSVVVEGVGHPLLFVHGFPLDGRMWDFQRAFFAQKYQVIVPDLPGFGKSELGESVMPPSAYADVLAELLAGLQIDQLVTLCGLSMGGYIALEFWKRHPSKLSRLILTHTKASADSSEAIANRKKVAESALENGSKEMATAMPKKLTSAGTQNNNHSLIERLSKMISDQSGVAIAAASLGMAERKDFVLELNQINIPTLVIAGSDDALIPAAEMKGMSEAIPSSEFIVINQAGHLSPMEQPEIFNMTLQSFLQG